MEGKKNGKIQERVSKSRLVLDPTIQEVVIHLHTKYEHHSFHGCGEFFDEKFHQKGDGRKVQKDRRTDVNQYTPHFFKAGI